jgi:hypothetical protein
MKIGHQSEDDMAETQTELIERLIAENNWKLGKLRAQLDNVETGELRVGKTEVGVTGGDISQQWAQQLREWIADRVCLSADLEGVLKGTRSSV